MEKEMIINLVLLFAALCFLIIYRYLKKQSKTPVSDYNQIYEKIINSDEYKVKGQYEE